jgi:hypothetical protein
VLPGAVITRAVLLKSYACCIHLLKKLSEATSDQKLVCVEKRREGQKHAFVVCRIVHLPEDRNLCHRGCCLVICPGTSAQQNEKHCLTVLVHSYLGSSCQGT